MDPGRAPPGQVWRGAGARLAPYTTLLPHVSSLPSERVAGARPDHTHNGPERCTQATPCTQPRPTQPIARDLVLAQGRQVGSTDDLRAITRGGPNYATNILVYKVFNDGFINLDLGGSAAQSVVLMIVVIMLTVVQFRFIERKVHY